MYSLSWVGYTHEALANENQRLKDRNDELEFCLYGKTVERGRTKKRGRRTSR